MTSPVESMDAAVQIGALVMRFAESDPVILNIPQLNIAHGEFVSIIGASGGGKSTLLRLIAGLLQPTSGSVGVEAGSQTGLVFQDANLIPWRDAEQNIVLPAELGANARPVKSSEVSRLLRLVALNDADRVKRSAELSGGMQMRVSLARALVLSP
ncbi:MAG: ABC transporter ATP-binding protein, partial [Fuerstiella sp.]|nr:ABC transporter ATP-binding protein [Fuerstiella sp.]